MNSSSTVKVSNTYTTQSIVPVQKEIPETYQYTHTLRQKPTNATSSSIDTYNINISNFK